MGNETRCDVQYSNGDKNNSERTRVVLLLIRRGCALRTHLDMLPCAGPVRIKVNYSLRIEHTHACVGAFGLGWTLGCVQINGQPYGYGLILRSLNRTAARKNEPQTTRKPNQNRTCIYERGDTHATRRRCAHHTLNWSQSKDMRLKTNTRHHIQNN